MAERGMGADARTLVRSCVETAIVLRAAAVDVDDILRKLSEADDKHRLTMANVLLNDPAHCRELDAEGIDRLKKVTAEIKAKYPGNKGPSPIVWEQLAHKSETTHLYNTVYRLTSGDAAHPTGRTLDRHLKVNADNLELSLRPNCTDLAETYRPQRCVC